MPELDVEDRELRHWSRERLQVELQCLRRDMRGSK